MIERNSNYEFWLELGSARISPSRAAADLDECAEDSKLIHTADTEAGYRAPSRVCRWYCFRNCSAP
jgi:hypothetical protein